MDIQKADAIRAYGTQRALAEALGISRAAVAMWPDDRPIPREHALALRYELRADIFGPSPTDKGVAHGKRGRTKRAA